MKLDDDEVQAAYYGVAACLRQRQIGGRPVPPEVRQLYERLDQNLRLSRKRHETGGVATDAGPSQTWIDAADTAALLGRGLRWVQRHAAELGGERFGGRWHFKQSDVIDSAERHAAHD
jgi:hypothetical protein